MEAKWKRSGSMKTGKNAGSKSRLYTQASPSEENVKCNKSIIQWKPRMVINHLYGSNSLGKNHSYANAV